MHFVYFLQLNNGNIYKGSTDDIERRMREHKYNKVASTKNKEPILIGYEVYYLKSDALRREKYLKTTEGRRLLKQQYRDAINSMGSPDHPIGCPVE